MTRFLTMSAMAAILSVTAAADANAFAGYFGDWHDGGFARGGGAIWGGQGCCYDGFGGAAGAAAGLAVGGGRISSDSHAHHGDRVSNSHRQLLSGHGQTYQWDPWGHWGGYYGPMIGLP